jgi:hypothetical protein
MDAFMRSWQVAECVTDERLLRAFMVICCLCRLRYDDELFKLLDRLIREMDRKIEKAKERAEAESRPKVLRPEDQKRLDEIQERIQGTY